MNQVRQGDVLVMSSEIPSGARCVTGRRRIVLAEGEVSGHYHTMSRKTSEHHEHEGVMYLRVNEPTDLTHQEHGTITIEPGEYLVRRQVEEWMDEVRQVAD